MLVILVQIVLFMVVKGNSIGVKKKLRNDQWKLIERNYMQHNP